jgi:hypothetical protein
MSRIVVSVSDRALFLHHETPVRRLERTALRIHEEHRNQEKRWYILPKLLSSVTS